ncbi:MAG: choice-of-anchor J domain-containing protein [Flavobacteriales bacterium]|nr:choice-of-anchor J domain-containing protein [Flavobacteriales bacterium]
MRTPFLLLALATAPFVSAQVIPPYSTGFEGQVGNLAPLFPDGWNWEDLNTVPLGNQSWQIIKNTVSQTNAHTDSTAAHMFSHGSEMNNDWLYTPGMQLQGGTTYTISFWYSVAPLFPSTERLALYAGPAPTALAMTETLWSNTNIENPVYEQAVVEYTPDDDEVRYFAFHYFSEEFQFILLLDDVSITYDGASIAERGSADRSVWCDGRSLTVSIDTPVNGELLVITDASGRAVLERPLTAERTTFGLDGLSEGIYLASVTDRGRTSRSQRIAVAR